MDPITDTVAAASGLDPLTVSSNAGTVFAVVYLANKFGLIDKLPENRRWLAPLLAAAGVAAYQALVAGKTFGETVQIALAALFTAVGVHKLAKDSPLKYGDPK